MSGGYSVWADFDLGIAKIIGESGQKIELNNRRQLDRAITSVEDAVLSGKDVTWYTGSGSEETVVLSVPREKCRTLLGYLREVVRIADERIKAYDKEF